MDASQLMFKEGLMRGERILVTGGGSGLGKEMTEAFVKLGADVYICDWSCRFISASNAARSANRPKNHPYPPATSLGAWTRK